MRGLLCHSTCNVAQPLGASTSEHYAPPDVGHAPSDLEAAQYRLQRHKRSASSGKAQHNGLRTVRQIRQSLSYRLDALGHQVGCRTNGIADTAHGVVDCLPCLSPHLRRGFAAFGQVLVENACRILRVVFQLLVQSTVGRVGCQRRLDLHVGEDIASAQGLFQGVEHRLGFLRVGLLADVGLGFGHLRGLGRVGGLDVLHGQGKAGLKGRHALLNARVQRRLIVDTGIRVSLDHLPRTDLLHPVLEVVGRFVRATGGFHLHLQHRAQRADCIHAGAAVFLHARQQLRKPPGHVGGFKAARLALQGDSLQGLLHDLRVTDLGVLLQGLNHARRIDAAGPLANGELGRRRRVGQRLVQLHAGANQLVDQVGHFVARHAGVLRSLDDGAGHLRFFRLVGHVCLDRDVTDDRLIVRADLAGHTQRTHANHGLANARLDPGLALLDLLVSLDLQIGRLGRSTEPLIFAVEATYFDTLFAQALQVTVQLAQQPGRRGRTAVVRLLPLLAQANGFADGALQHLGLVALLLQLLDAAGNRIEGSPHRRTDGTADDQS
ncbi:hypothetical protein D3C77_244700 [compost metagenome]